MIKQLLILGFLFAILASWGSEPIEDQTIVRVQYQFKK